MQRNSANTRLSKRLRALFEAIPENSKTVYDLCCDHGFLGRAILENAPGCKVVFNDINPGITSALAKKLESTRASGYAIHTGPAEDAYQKSDEPSTVVLAGIGDEQSIKILSSLLRHSHARHSTFIISPATKVAYVRDFLSNQPVELMMETTVTDNKRTYEVIVIRLATDKNFQPVSLVGNCWKPNLEHQQHIEKLIRYYEPKRSSSHETVTAEIISEYKNILKKIKKTA